MIVLLSVPSQYFFCSSSVLSEFTNCNKDLGTYLTGDGGLVRIRRGIRDRDRYVRKLVKGGNIVGKG